MPNRDGTGPMGEGAKTGRGLGKCKTDGQGPGFGRGNGFGQRATTPVSSNKEEQKKSE